MSTSIVSKLKVYTLPKELLQISILYIFSTAETEDRCKMGTRMLFTFMSFGIMMSSDAFCQDTWTLFGDYCYKFIKGKVTWYDAQVICNSANSSLINIDSKDENDFAAQWAVEYESSVWIGLSDLVQEGHFVWEFLNPPKFTNWASGQPDNAGGRENCAYLADFFWKDERCDNKFSAICEKFALM